MTEDFEADQHQNLRNAAALRSERAAAAVERALMALEARGEAVNFQAVAKAAGVSTGYLYGHATFRRRIADRRATPPQRVAASKSATRSQDTGQQTKLAASAREIKRLRAENAQLRVENERLRGDLAAAQRR